jgi:phytanoyl-CoA hydroxylase
MDGIMLGRVRYPTLQMQLDTGGAYEDLPEPIAGLPEASLAYRKVQGLESDPLVLEFIRRDLFREICARHYGNHASVSIFRVMLMNKPAGKGTYLPWHQDAGDVWKLDRDPLVTLWVSLDPSTRMNGCLQVIPGSHRLGLLSKNGSTISPAHAQLYCPDEAIEYLELKPGEALLLHNWLLHRSDVNRTDTPRRALSVCYIDGRTLNTLTGNRFPIVFGENEDAESALLFLRGMKDENRQLREMAFEAERYAKSLLADKEYREQIWREAERYQRFVWRTIDAVRRCGARLSATRRR